MLKTGLWTLIFLLLPTAIFAWDLHALAKRERSRRAQLRARGRQATSFTDEDLNRRHTTARQTYRTDVSAPRSNRRIEKERKERVEAERHWRREREKHLRGQQQLSAKIRRLEWRYQERLNRLNPEPHRRRLRDDPTLSVLESSLNALREDYRRQEQAFLERGRRAGALPGWLR